MVEDKVGRLNGPGFDVLSPVLVIMGYAQFTDSKSFLIGIHCLVFSAIFS